MLKLKCDICNKLITKPGALLFSPPIDDSWTVKKFHICVECYKQLFGFLHNEEDITDVELTD